MSACPQQALMIPPKTVVFSQTTFGTDILDSNGCTERQIIDSSLITKSGGLIQLTIQAGPNGGLSIDEMWVGHAAGSGNVWDFDGTQVQVTRGGSTTISTGTPSAVLLTDPITYALDETKNLIISTQFDGTSFIVGQSGITGTTYCFKAASATAADTAPAGFSTFASILTLTKYIEVLG